MRRIILILLLFILVGCSQAEPSPPAGEPPPPGDTLSPTTAISPPATLSAPTPIQTEPPGEPSQSASSSDPSPTTAPTAIENVQAFPDPAAYQWLPVASGLDAPLGVAHAGDGTGRLFILEKAGLIRILLNGQVSSQPFLDIRDRVGSSGSEQGLLGLAFHPDYAQNGYFFVNYTNARGNTIIARFQVSPGQPDQADPASETQLLQVSQPYGNHNGGVVAFGPDGYLYLGLGDGGSAGDPQNNAQSLATLLGKVLRIDVDSADQPYAIPPDNPFPSGASPEIWAYGLRNPWRMAFDRISGDLYIGDVGQNEWEEIDYLPAGSPGGANFGWDYFEGNHPYEGTPPQDADFIAPIAEYNHSLGCSVTGGVVYRGQALPDWQGIYLYGDYCTGRIWGLLRNASGEWTSQVLFENLGRIASFGEDEAGEVYIADLSGTVYQLAQR